MLSKNKQSFYNLSHTSNSMDWKLICRSISVMMVITTFAIALFIALSCDNCIAGFIKNKRSGNCWNAESKEIYCNGYVITFGRDCTMENIFIMTANGFVDISHCKNATKITFTEGCPQHLILPIHGRVEIRPIECATVEVSKKFFVKIY